MVNDTHVTSGIHDTRGKILRGIYNFTVGFPARPALPHLHEYKVVARLAHMKAQELPGD